MLNTMHVKYDQNSSSDFSKYIVLNFLNNKQDTSDKMSYIKYTYGRLSGRNYFSSQFTINSHIKTKSN